MLTHCVFFWSKAELSASDAADFEAGLQTLLTIPSVVAGKVGVPASTARPVVERSYAYALMVTFKDLADHDAYQVDPIHDAFLARCSKYWGKVVVYDFVAPH